MSLDEATVAHIAMLARIEVPEARRPAVASELSNILGWIEQLNEVDTSNVEPMRSVMDIRATLRDDVIADGGRAEDILANAPEREDGYFVVPRVVE
jgi:aspartyl-tRNA(Asn)/glutamyl-tRNA(Gln) amidotransferase subunit C